MVDSSPVLWPLSWSVSKPAFCTQVCRVERGNRGLKWWSQSLGVMLCCFPPLTWLDTPVGTMNNTQAWERIGQVFPKMAKGTSEEEQVLKKNDILELFDFMLHHRMKLCPGRNSDTVGIHPELGKQLSSLHTRNWEGRTQNTVWGK